MKPGWKSRRPVFLHRGSYLKVGSRGIISRVKQIEQEKLSLRSPKRSNKRFRVKEAGYMERVACIEKTTKNNKQTGLIVLQISAFNLSKYISGFLLRRVKSLQN